MKPLIPTTLLLLTGIASAQSTSLTDRAGLELTVSDSSVESVVLNGRQLTLGGRGGFYLCEPGSETRVPLAGKTVYRDGTLQLSATSPLRARVEASYIEGNGYIEIQGELQELTGTDRGLWLGFNLPVNTLRWKWGQSLSNSAVVTEDNPGYAKDNNLVPLPAVWNDDGGIALCIPPDSPCVFETAADSKGLRIQMAFGLSQHTAKFPSKARFCFRIYSIDGTWGFRDALAKYYDWYPEYYSIEPWMMRALDHHHDWIGANYVSDDESWVSTDHLIRRDKTRYMAYTKTSGRIQGLENVSAIKTQPHVLAAIASVDTIHHYCKNATFESPELQMGRRALLNSVCYRPDQTFATILKPKTGEIDFPINCDPDLFSGSDEPVFGKLFLQKTEEISKHGNFDSVHWDRVGGWGNSLNYRSEHFAYVDHPLTFDQEGRVCIHTKLTHYELFDALRKQGKRLRIFHEAAGMKVYGWKKQPNRPAGHSSDGRFFTAAVVAGGWHEGSFKPIELGGMDFERMVVGRKSYRISSGNIVAHDEPPTLEKVKRALAQTTAYGFACPVQIQYFYDVNHPHHSEKWSWINKPEHQKLWESYELANLAIRLAGWEPMTYAVADSDDVQVERFGRGDEIYLTVWGVEPPETVSIEVEGTPLGPKPTPQFQEIVSKTEIEVARTPKGWRLSLPMEENMTRVIRIQ